MSKYKVSALKNGATIIVYDTGCVMLRMEMWQAEGLRSALEEAITWLATSDDKKEIHFG